MKVLNLKITNCRECPYLRYDAEYGRSYDSGYDCTNTKTNTAVRLIDDNELSRWGRWPFDIHPICPLDDERL